MAEASVRGVIAASSLVLGALFVLAPATRSTLGLVMAFGAGVLISASPRARGRRVDTGGTTAGHSGSRSARAHVLRRRPLRDLPLDVPSRSPRPPPSSGAVVRTAGASASGSGSPSSAAWRRSRGTASSTEERRLGSLVLAFAGGAVRRACGTLMPTSASSGKGRPGEHVRPRRRRDRRGQERSPQQRADFGQPVCSQPTASRSRRRLAASAWSSTGAVQVEPRLPPRFHLRVEASRVASLGKGRSEGQMETTRRLSRRTFVAWVGGASAGFYLFGRLPGTAAPVALAQVPGGTLDPAEIPKFRTPLLVPPVMPRADTLRQRGGKPIDYYEISMRQFEQQVLPAGLPATTVWGYGARLRRRATVAC